MLILVGVTVATISDGGIFEKAKTAVEKTEEQAIYETIIGEIEFDANGKIDVKATGDSARDALEKQGKTVSFSQESETFGTFEVNGSNGKTDTYKITENEIEKVSNPWIARGLSPNWTFGKWYVNGEGNGTICLGEDGSFLQDRRDGIIHMEMTSEQIEQVISGGMIAFNKNEIISVNQLKFVLNGDGTVTLHVYDSAAEEYVETNDVYTVEQ